MMKSLTRLIAPCIAILIISAYSCGHKNKPGQTTANNKTGKEITDTFIYNFGDASTSPLYHRSYSIWVVPGKIYFSIDVYGEIRSPDTMALSKPAYDSFAAAINNLHIKPLEEIKTEGCTGGKTDALELYAGSDHAVKGHIYHCGGQDYGNLDGDMLAAASLFKALIPDLEQRIDASRKNN